MTMTLISTVTVGSGGANTVSFSSIPQTATDLCVLASVRATASNSGLAFWFNAYTGTGYSSRYLQGSNNFVNSSTNLGGTGQAGFGAVPISSFTASTFSNSMLYIPNYAGATAKSFTSDTVTENNASLTNLIIDAGLWTGTAAISSITFAISGSGSNLELAQYSTFSLYSITKGSGGATVS